MSLIFRTATEEDLDAVMALYAAARAFMRAVGNPDQWPEGYPPRASVAEDIGRGIVYLAEDDEGVAAVFSFAVTVEEPYERLLGTWLSEERPYGVLHRLAVARRGGGIGSACLGFALSRCTVLKIDTHEKNLPMQALLKKHGFTYCGVVDYGDDGTRIAFSRPGLLAT